MPARPLSAHATLSSKGQLVIPKAMREALGLHSGSEVLLTMEPNGSLNLSPLKLPLEGLFGMLYEAGRERVDVDDVIRKRMPEKYL